MEQRTQEHLARAEHHHDIARLLLSPQAAQLSPESPADWAGRCLLRRRPLRQRLALGNAPVPPGHTCRPDRRPRQSSPTPRRPGLSQPPGPRLPGPLRVPLPTYPASAHRRCPGRPGNRPPHRPPGSRPPTV